MDELGIKLSADEQKMNVRPLMALVGRRFFGDAQGFVDMCAEHIPPPSEGSRIKVAHAYTGPADAPLTISISNCDPEVGGFVY